MLFCQDINIPPNTTPDAPYRTFIDVTTGNIKIISVRFRYGSANLCGVRLLYAEFQFCPLSMGEWIVSSPYPYEFEGGFLIEDVPHQITVECYNLDDTFNHHVLVGMDIVRETTYTLGMTEVTI